VRNPTLPNVAPTIKPTLLLSNEHEGSEVGLVGGDVDASVEDLVVSALGAVVADVEAVVEETAG